MWLAKITAIGCKVSVDEVYLQLGQLDVAMNYVDHDVTFLVFF